MTPAATPSEPLRLLLGSTNPGKLLELRQLLADLPLVVVSPQEVGLGAMEVEETGDTFLANAELKARAFAQASGLHTLADDSGLMVDALDGRPGVHSARYGGPGLDNAGRRRRLLDALRDVPPAARTARFVCVITVAAPGLLTCTSVTGVCQGRIAEAESGTGGFGYDPLFIPDGYAETFGVLDETVKHQISHRGRATQQIIPVLRALAGGG